MNEYSNKPLLRLASDGFLPLLQAPSTRTWLLRSLLFIGTLELLLALSVGMSSWGLIPVPTILGALLWLCLSLQRHSGETLASRRPRLVVIGMITALGAQTWASIYGQTGPIDGYGVARFVFMAGALFLLSTYILSWCARGYDLASTRLLSARALLLTVLAWSPVNIVLADWLTSLETLPALKQATMQQAMLAMIMLALSVRPRFARYLADLSFVIWVPLIAWMSMQVPGSAHPLMIINALMFGMLWPLTWFTPAYLIMAAYYAVTIALYPSELNLLSLMLIINGFGIVAGCQWLRTFSLRGQTRSEDLPLTDSTLNHSRRRRIRLAGIWATVASAVCCLLVMVLWAPHMLQISTLLHPTMKTLNLITAALLVVVLATILTMELLERRYERRQRTAAGRELSNFRAIIDEIETALVLADENAVCRLANQAAIALTSDETTGLIGTQLRTLDGWHRAGLETLFTAALEHGQRGENVASTRRDAQSPTLRISLRPVLFDGRPHVLIQGVDVSALINNQRALEKAELLRADINRLARLGEAIRDFERDEITFDAHSAHWLGFGDGSASVTMPVSRYELLLHRDELATFREFSDLVRNTDIEFITQERHLVTAQGERFINYHFRIERDADGRALRARALMVDQTELKTALIEAQTAIRARGQFIANMNHELRTPLNAIMGFGMLLGQAALDVRNKSYLKKLMQAANRLQRMIEDILDIQSLDQGTLQLRPTPFKLGDLIAATTASLHGACASKGLELITNPAPENLHVSLLGDASRIGQIIYNLLDNAVKFTDTGQVRLDVELGQGTLSNRCALIIKVSDTGQGIASQRLEELTKALKQSDESTTKRYRGIGAGLTIVKTLTEKMNGSLIVESAINAGSVFTVKLELGALQGATVGESNRLSSAAGEDYRVPNLHGRHILIVDDSEIYVKSLEEILKRTGATVTAARNGFAAMQWLTLRGNHADLILLDIRMDTMNGFEMLHALRQEPDLASTPVIIVSNYDSSDRRQQAAGLGVMAFIHKPFDTQDLFGAILQVFDGSGPTAKHPQSEDYPDQSAYDPANKATGGGRPALVQAQAASKQAAIANLLQALNHRNMTALDLYKELRESLLQRLGDARINELDSAIERLRFNWAVDILQHAEFTEHEANRQRSAHKSSQ